MQEDPEGIMICICVDCGRPYELPEGKEPDTELRKRCSNCIPGWYEKQRIIREKEEVKA
jgi:hypothetical protein